MIALSQFKYGLQSLRFYYYFCIIFLFFSLVIFNLIFMKINKVCLMEWYRKIKILWVVKCLFTLIKNAFLLPKKEVKFTWQKKKNPKQYFRTAFLMQPFS